MNAALLEQSGAYQEPQNGSITAGVRRARAAIYPDSDGKPMAETPEHRDAMTYAISAARAALDGISDVWVSGNDFVYYAEGEPSKRVSPDCYIVLNVPAKARRSYKAWEEGGRTPNVVFEFTSPKTAKEDREEKFDLYERVLRVNEYFLYDPLNQYLKPRLQGYRLVNGAYRPIPFDEDGRLTSQETGIKMFADDHILRFVHPRTGEVIRTYEEADDEIARLRAELKELRGSAR